MKLSYMLAARKSIHNLLVILLTILRYKINKFAL